MNGILNVDKPQGKTSYSIVALLKRLSGERRVGHAGTLDPLATGVLPVCLGQGTRVVEFLAESTKTYRAQIELGVSTDTYDAEGRIIEQNDPSGVTRALLESALGSFRGSIWQVPPMYSAVKYRGKPLYKLARSGVEVERTGRQAEIHHLELLDWRMPVATVEVECGKGTYIRSLAHDLGQVLGCGATLKSLVRTKYGPFTIEDAVTIAELENAFHHGYWQSFIQPIDTVLLHYAAIVVDEQTGRSIRNGNPLAIDAMNAGEQVLGCVEDTAASGKAVKRCRVYTSDGCLLAVLRYEPEEKQWHPEKVFAV